MHKSAYNKIPLILNPHFLQWSPLTNSVARRRAKKVLNKHRNQALCRNVSGISWGPVGGWVFWEGLKDNRAQLMSHTADVCKRVCGRVEATESGGSKATPFQMSQSVRRSGW